MLVFFLSCVGLATFVFIVVCRFLDCFVVINIIIIISIVLDSMKFEFMNIFCALVRLLFLLLPLVFFLRVAAHRFAHLWRTAYRRSI